MPRKVVQGYLYSCDDGVFPERDATVCQIVARAIDSEGELLGHGAAFWVRFGDD